MMQPMKALVIMLLAACAAAGAQNTVDVGPRPKPTRRAAPQPRPLVLFGGLERKMANAIQQKDTETLNAMVTDDCEIRTSDAPLDPEGCAEWLANELPNYELKSYRIGKMAVRLFGDKTAVVSMKYSETAKENGRDLSGDSFLVDVWTKSADGWKFAVRYLTPVPKGDEPPADIKLLDNH